MEGSGRRQLVFSAMRNEGAFLVEWVAWFRMLGFDILVAHNDCTDRSPDLLAAFEAAGWLTAFEHRPPPDVPPKLHAHARLRERAELAAADWLLICDADELLILREGGGRVAGYLDWATAAVGRDFAGIAFHWRCFGTSGWDSYRDGLVHRQFRRCGPARMNPNVFFKTLLRDPMRFRALGDHGPAHPRGGDWGDPGLVILDSALRAIPEFATGAGHVRFTGAERIVHASGQMNHYVLRSAESFALKRGRPSASAFADRYTDGYFRRRDRNGQLDESALDYADAFDRVHAEAMALPDVRRLHHLCCADHVASLVAVRGGRPEQDPRWQDHMAAADRR